MLGLPRCGLLLSVALAIACAACEESGGAPQPDAAIPQGDRGAEPLCPGGVDHDGDGFGDGCPKGRDCDDADPFANPAAKEICDGRDNNCDGKVDEGVKNACGTCDPSCGSLGKTSPFPTATAKDPNLRDANGVGLDENGDLVLDRRFKQTGYMWIANTLDPGGSAKGCSYARRIVDNQPKDLDPKLYPYCRGTISKIDTGSMKEVARYFTTTCSAKGGSTGCLDVNGKPFLREFAHAPSRTAVDFNFDVWVANRAFGGQPSATKIASDPADCIDRNKNLKIDTSRDLDGDGKITVDCNGDGKPDDAKTVCTLPGLAGKGPEFLGDDDECILFTVAYGDPPSPTNPKDLGDIGRSICLDSGKSNVGASSAWVGTHTRPSYGRGNNRFYKINGATGKIEASVEMPTGHSPYGCTADGHNVIWSTSGAGTLAFHNALAPHQVGPLLTSPKVLHPSHPQAATKQGVSWHYGITADDEGKIWLGGASSCRVLRYRPDRQSFAAFHKGSWTVIHVPLKAAYTRGIAADLRGKVWIAGNAGYLLRLDESIADAPPGKDFIEHDRTASADIWPLSASGVSGAGVDIAGNVWGIGGNGIASRLDVDDKGLVANPPTGTTKKVAVGASPYTYSDFTGYGLQNFVRPQGRYVYRVTPCPDGQLGRWKQVSWRATTPAGTSVTLRARSGSSDATMGSWLGPHTSSPALLDKGAIIPLSPNPARFLEVEFTLKTDLNSVSPILHDFDVAFDCTPTPA
jgi:streptogramin lyase